MVEKLFDGIGFGSVGILIAVLWTKVADQGKDVVRLESYIDKLFDEIKDLRKELNRGIQDILKNMK